MLQLNYRDPRPIYQQVKDGLRRLVLTGVLTTGDKLPSIRTLATTLAINPNTIQKAYDALESEGYLRSAPGKGFFVTHAQSVDDRRREVLLCQFDAAITELCYLGISPAALISRIQDREEISQ